IVKTRMHPSFARRNDMDCRLLYLVGQLGIGGLERQLCYLLQAMDRKRYKPMVAVWHYCERDTYVHQIRALGVPLHFFLNTPSRAGKLRAFRRLVRKLKPEVVHSYSFYTNFAAWWATLGSKVIPIGAVQSDFINDRRESGRILGRLSARWPGVQICNSLAAKNTAERSIGLAKPTRIYIVRNGLDIDQFRPYPLPQSRMSLLAVGRLSPEKRWDRLLK